MSNCLNDGTLRTWLDGELPEARALHARAHLEACAACRGRRERMEAGVRGVASLLDLAAPEDLAAIPAAKSRRRWLALAAAAAMTAAMALFFTARQPQRTRVAVVKSPAAAPAVAPQPVVARAATPSRAVRAFRRRTPRPSQNDFVPFADAGPMQVGMVVRVTLTAANLSPDGGVRQIAADLIIGEDGRARAIRFVE